MRYVNNGTLVGDYMKKIISLILVSISFLTFAADSDFYALFSPHQGEQAFKEIYKNIGGAKSKVYATIYSWSDSKVKDAFIKALENEAEVKIILHPSLAKKKRVIDYSTELEKLGADVKIAKMNMHEKFLIVDDQWLMNSSANMSGGAKSRYSENFVFHTNKTAAGKKLMDEFNDEFAVLWNSSKDFYSASEGNAEDLKIEDSTNLPESGDPTLYSSTMNFTFKNTKVTSKAFKQGKYITLYRRNGKSNQTWKVTQMIIDEIDNAQENILLNLNHLNIAEIAQALARASKRGIDVKLVVDNQEFKTTTKAKEKTPLFVSLWKKLPGNAKKEAPVRVKYYSLAPSPMHWKLNHHKYLLIDYDEKDFSKTKLITGSHNLSRTAEHNQFDNQVIYSGKDFSGLFKDFKGEFDRLWNFNRNENDKPDADLYKRITTPYKGSMYLHSKRAISLTWSEVIKVRKTVYKFAPGIFKNTYKNRDCRFFVLATKSFGGCPNK
jgi:phosphatidylserine/phosphatidylglycerophosphate/cardiolipin synthase-like enzyme